MPTINRSYLPRKEAGLCPRCGDPRAGPSVHCERCLIRAARAHNDEYRARKAAGLCVRCGLCPGQDGHECRICRVRRKKARLRRKARGG